MIKKIYQILIVSGFIIYIASLYLPILSIQELYIFENEITILSTLTILLNEREWLLYCVILIFAIILPISKYILLFACSVQKLSSKNSQFINDILGIISKWAMLDVFIVAVFIASIKLKMLTTAQSLPGLYFFVTSIIISIICTQLQNTFLKKKI